MNALSILLDPRFAKKLAKMREQIGIAELLRAKAISEFSGTHEEFPGWIQLQAESGDAVCRLAVESLVQSRARSTYTFVIRW